jgi:hypothetical protein
MLFALKIPLASTLVLALIEPVLVFSNKVIVPSFKIAPKLLLFDISPVFVNELTEAPVWTFS